MRPVFLAESPLSGRGPCSHILKISAVQVFSVDLQEKMDFSFKSTNLKSL